MRRARGFTLLETVITLAIFVGLTALAAASWSRLRPRASLASTGTELQALFHTARQTALATGHDVAVLVFPDFANPNRSTGRVIVYEDPFYDFFTGGATGGVTFADYQPGSPRSGQAGGVQSSVLEIMDLPSGVTVGPATGMGSSATLAAPFATVAVNVACSFCDASGGSRRGAVKFDARGNVQFYNSTGSGGVSTRLDLPGGASISLQAPDVTGQRTLVISAPSGALRAIVGG